MNDFAIAVEILHVDALMFLRAGDRIGAFVGTNNLRAAPTPEGVGESNGIDVDAYRARIRHLDLAAQQIFRRVH